MKPDHLRAAIERIGIEKPSDVTLVMEEVGRMEAEERLVERVARAIDPFAWLNEYGTAYRRQCSIDGAKGAIKATSLITLLAAAEAVLAAGIVNPTGSMKVANAMDALVKAVREVEG